MVDILVISFFGIVDGVVWFSKVGYGWIESRNYRVFIVLLILIEIKKKKCV